MTRSTMVPRNGTEGKQRSSVTQRAELGKFPKLQEPLLLSRTHTSLVVIPLIKTLCKYSIDSFQMKSALIVPLYVSFLFLHSAVTFCLCEPYVPKLMKPASKLNPPLSVAACHRRIGLKLSSPSFSLSLSLPLPVSPSVLSVFEQVSQLRNCLHPTQAGAGLKFPIGYVPICREHTSTDAIREQAYELPGSLPSLSSDRMALIPDYDPNNNTTTT